MISLAEFINQLIGQTNAGNNDQNRGQCVGLVSLWQDNLGVPHEYGNAKDLLANADTSFFDVVQNDLNDTNQFPVAGDIIIWDDTWGNGFGHCAIVVTANGNSFTSFEQNDITPEDPSGACEVLGHSSYLGVEGWLHPKNIQVNVVVDDPTFKKLVHNSNDYDAVCDYFGVARNSDYDPIILQKLNELIDKANTNAQPFPTDPKPVVEPSTPTPPAPSTVPITETPVSQPIPTAPNTPSVPPSNSTSLQDILKRVLDAISKLLKR